MSNQVTDDFAPARELLTFLSTLEHVDMQERLQSKCLELALHFESAAPGGELDGALEIVCEAAFLADRLGFDWAPVSVDMENEGEVRLTSVNVTLPYGGRVVSHLLAAHISRESDGSSATLGFLHRPMENSDRSEVVRRLRLWSNAASTRLATREASIDRHLSRHAVATLDDLIRHKLSLGDVTPVTLPMPARHRSRERLRRRRWAPGPRVLGAPPATRTGSVVTERDISRRALTTTLTSRPGRSRSDSACVTKSTRPGSGLRSTEGPTPSARSGSRSRTRRRTRRGSCIASRRPARS